MRRFDSLMKRIALSTLALFIASGTAPASDLNVGSKLPGQLSITINSQIPGSVLGVGSHVEYAGTIPGTTLDGKAAPIYCVDLTRFIFVPGDYNNTGTSTVGLIFNSPVNNYRSIGYLVNHFGASAGNNAADSAGLQGAIWKAEYGNLITINDSNNNADLHAAYMAYSNYIRDIGNVDSGIFTANVNGETALFLSPMKKGSDTRFQGQVTPFPEPASVVLLGLQIVGLGGGWWWKRRRSTAMAGA